MKHSLIVLAAVLLGGCASLGQPAGDGTAGAAMTAATGLVGEYDNHAEVWQAEQDKTALRPQHVHHRLVAVAHADATWDWTLDMDQPQGKALTATWRYTARALPDGRVMLTPARELPGAAKSAPTWAPLAPCAMVGKRDGAQWHVAADVAACSAILPGLGAAGALLPLRLDTDGTHFEVATFADQTRGAKAMQHAVRVRWFSGWSAINGAGPDATADSKDWHMQRDLRLHDQGGALPIRWRDGQPSGYSIELEELDYRQRDTRVLKLSLRRDADRSVIAYAWANPAATQIGLNLGWVQVGLTLTPAPKP